VDILVSTATMPSLGVEDVAIDELRPDPANPRRIGEDELDALERSLRQFGFVQPVLARRVDRTVIGGHQRLTAARRLGYETVPVIWLDLSTDQARVLGLALNKISGSWDEQLLARLLGELQEGAEVDLTLSGFDDDEVRELLRSLETREKRERQESFDLAEALEEARRSPRSKPGDLWQLGDHRLLCGDATKLDDVARLLGDATPTLLTTDPPYGVALDPTWRDGVYNALGSAEKPYLRTKGHRNTTLSGDTRVDWADAFVLVPSLTVGYVWHAGVHAAAVAEGLIRTGFEIVAQVIWDKGLFAIGRSWYHWSHEPCWVVRKAGSKAKFLGPRDQATVWRAPSPKMIMAGSSERKEDHPTQKPLTLFETPIRNHLRPGGAVYDPFVGSGTTLIAAERSGVRAFAVEIDPVYVEVALRRWERFSGAEAVRVDD
jgi:DNA modification methylase